MEIEGIIKTEEVGKAIDLICDTLELNKVSVVTGINAMVFCIMWGLKSSSYNYDEFSVFIHKMKEVARKEAYFD